MHSKVVSEALGHGSIAITLDTYSAYVPTLGTADERPAGSEGATEQELAARVSRDAMIGVQRL